MGVTRALALRTTVGIYAAGVPSCPGGHMTTTHHHEQTAPPSELGERRRKRLSTLLVRRSRLAVRWAEEQSHLLPGADDLAHELAVVEQAISHCYPSVYDQKF